MIRPLYTNPQKKHIFFPPIFLLTLIPVSILVLTFDKIYMTLDQGHLTKVSWNMDSKVEG